MRIAFAGPITLSMLSDRFAGIDDYAGYPFAGSAPLVMGYLARGHEVDIVTSSPDIHDLVRFTSPGCRLTLVPSRVRARDRALDQFAYERENIRLALREFAPDIVHAHWTYEFGLGSIHSGLKTVVTVHDWAPAIAAANRHIYWYLRALMQINCLVRARNLTAPSEYIASKVRRYYRKDCVVIPNSLNAFPAPPAPAAHALRDPQHDMSKTFNVGMLNVGFTPRKNVQNALRAWRSVTKAVPRAVLALAGPGFEEGGPAQTWAFRNGLGAGVEFRGALRPEEVSEWLSGLDVFLHASREESFGMVLIEAMAAGAPVVAGVDSGAVSEVAAGAARLIDVRSPRAIASEVIALLESATERNLLRAEGLRRAKEFQPDVMVDAYLEVLERAAI